MKFLKSWTFKDERLSQVHIEHKGHIFEGSAMCHPDDDWSEFTGCKFAELRAILAALKAEYREEKLKLDAIKDFINATSQYKKFDNESGTAKAMYRQYNRRVKKLEELAEDITAVKSAIAGRLKALESIQKKKQSKES